MLRQGIIKFEQWCRKPNGERLAARLDKTVRELQFLAQLTTRLGDVDSNDWKENVSLLVV